MSGFTQIWGNCRFSPGTGDPAFRLWAEGDVGPVTNTVQSKAAETEGQTSDKTSDIHSSDAQIHKMNANVAMCALDLK